MIKFETNVCPLCNKVMRLRQVGKNNVFDCKTQMSWMSEEGLVSTSHYAVEFQKDNIIQHMYLGQWGINNFADCTKSRLFKKEKVKNVDVWKFVSEIPHFRPAPESKLLEQLKQMVR